MSQIIILLYLLTFCPSLLAVECCHHHRLSLTKKALLQFSFWAALLITWYEVLHVWSRWPLCLQILPQVNCFFLRKLGDGGFSLFPLSPTSALSKVFNWGYILAWNIDIKKKKKADFYFYKSTFSPCYSTSEKEQCLEDCKVSAKDSNRLHCHLSVNLLKKADF